MTAQENVELVRRLFAAAARHDSETVLSMYDPDVEWDYRRGGMDGIMGPRIWTGHEGLRAWFRDWSDVARDTYSRYDEVFAVGDQVVSAGVTGGIGRSSGVPVEMRQAAVWTIRDGKVVRVVWFPSRDEAVAAAEASE